MSSLTAKIARGTLYLSLSSSAARLLSFLTVIFVTRGLTLFEYGVVTLVLSVTGPVNSISGLGMDELIVADVGKSLGEGNRSYAKKLLLSFFKIRFFIIIFLGFLGWFFRIPLEARYGPAITQYFLLVFILVLAQFFKNAFNLIFQIHQKFGQLSTTGVAEVVVRFTAVIVLWKIGALNVGTVLLSYILAAAIPILIFIPSIVRTIYYFKNADVENYPNGVILPLLARHGKWQLFLDVAGNAISSVRYWLIKIFLSTEAVAIFGVAQSMYSAVASLLPLKSVIFPIIASKSNEPPVMKKLLTRSTKYSLLLYAGLTAASVFIAPFFISAFFPKYLAGIFIFQLMSLRLIFNAFSISQAPLLIVLKEQRYVFLLSVVNAISVLIFSPIFMVTLGLPGAVLEGLLTVFIIILMREIFLRRKYGFASVSLNTFFTVDEYDKMILKRLWQRLRLLKSA